MNICHYCQFLHVHVDLEVFFLGILHEQQVMHSLMGLNDEYKNVRGNILMMQPLPNLSQTYRLILQEEKQRECNSSFSISSDSAALAASHNKNLIFQQNSRFSSATKPSTPSNFHDNGKGVTYGITPSGKRSKFYCTKCEIYGHSIER